MLWAVFLKNLDRRKLKVNWRLWFDIYPPENEGYSGIEGKLHACCIFCII